MKPAWDKLMEDFKGHPTALVADVDCTAAGQELCQKLGVQGYPTIKYGDPKKLQDYQGGRDFDSLKKFADSSLGPKCSPDSMKACSKKQQKVYQELMKKDVATLEAEVREKRKEFTRIEQELNDVKDVARYVRKKEREKKEVERKKAKEEKKKQDAAKAKEKKKQEAEKTKAEKESKKSGNAEL